MKKMRDFAVTKPRQVNMLRSGFLPESALLTPSIVKYEKKTKRLLFLKRITFIKRLPEL